MKREKLICVKNVIKKMTVEKILFGILSFILLTGYAPTQYIEGYPVKLYSPDINEDHIRQLLKPIPQEYAHNIQVIRFQTNTIYCRGSMGLYWDGGVINICPEYTINRHNGSTEHYYSNDTIIHELAHHLQFVNNERVGHGGKFREYEKRMQEMNKIVPIVNIGHGAGSDVLRFDQDGGNVGIWATGRPSLILHVDPVGRLWVNDFLWEFFIYEKYNGTEK